MFSYCQDMTFISLHGMNSGGRPLSTMSRHDLTSCHDIKLRENQRKRNLLPCRDIIFLKTKDGAAFFPCRDMRDLRHERNP